MAKKKSECCQDKSPFTGIAGVIGGISVAIVAIFLIFASSQAWVLAPVIGALVLMGIFLGYFQYKAVK